MNEVDIVRALNTFAFDLFRILCKDSNKNEFFSPFSVLTALNMVLIGAKNKTEKEMFEGLRYSLGFANSDEVHTYFKKLSDFWNQTDHAYTLDVANRVLVHKSDDFQVYAEYSKQLLDVYKAEVNEVDFTNDNLEIVESCNEWVNRVTKGKIPSILDELYPDNRAVLLNAIYFKGSWKKPFNEQLTADEPFYNFGNKEKAKNVPMMKGKTEGWLYSTTIGNEELQMFELPYHGGIVMSILMTKSVDGLQKIEPLLNCEIIEKMKVINQCKQVLSLWLPKFEMETSYELVEPIKSMGVRDAFSDNADFSGIANSPDLGITGISHKASIEVNEEGTVAAAAIASLRGGGCAMIIHFIVDHPFVYFIKDQKTGVILFAGIVNEL